MMEIIIKIPEKTFKYYVTLANKGEQIGNLERIILDGTPLPKGHGDLVDRKDLIENGISKGFCDWYDEIKMAETIIEADKESER